MDVIELLVLLAFILFPLLQSLLEKLGGKRGEQLPPADEAEPPAPMEAGVGGAREAEADLSEGGWSSGWGEWPTEELPEALQIEGPVTEREAERFIRSRESLDTRETELLPEAVRVKVPVVSMEPLHVDRDAEHRRLHTRMRPASPTPVPQRETTLEAALRSRSGVRQAVLLAEVLGPPRALNPLERPGGN